MKLLVLSDTHGRIGTAESVLEKIGGKMEAVLHLGDHAEDAAELAARFPKLRFFSVRGNNDDMQAPKERLLRLGGHVILMVHGHLHGVSWGVDRLYYRAMEQGADIALFGHTHRPYYEQSGAVLLMNPGSLSLPRGDGIPTFGILTLEDGRMEGAVMEYRGAERLVRKDFLY